MDSSQGFSFRRAAAFVVRHHWGVLTFSAAAFVWGVGAVSTPAPALVGGALAGIAGLTALALRRFIRRRRRAVVQAERTRTRVSLALYGTSLALATLFLGGLFVAPRAAMVVATPGFGSTAPALTAWIPALVSARAVPAVDRMASRLPALHELGSTLPLVGGGRREGARSTEDRLLPALASPETLRLLSLNVWHGYPGPGAREERYQRIRRLIADTEPDLVLLQESWSTRRFGRLAQRLSSELGLSCAYARANGSLRYLGFEEGLAILSRHPLSEVRRLSLGPRTPAWEMRAALGAVLTLPSGGALEVWNTHLSHSSVVGREGQARSLASALSRSRVAILAGDFNAGAASAAIAAFAPLELRPLLSEGIDHVLGSAALLEEWTPVLVEARRFGEVTLANGLRRPEVSDHPALVVELRRNRVPGARLVDAGSDDSTLSRPPGARASAGGATLADHGQLGSTLALGLRSLSPASR